MPVFDGKLRNSSIDASNPPAEPPMPTIGQLEFFLDGLARSVRAAGLDRADLLLLDFVREGRAPLLGVRFAAMAVFMVIAGFASDKLLICHEPIS